ncbi:cytochrome c biogenesis CcdA family protein [Radiobacillus sp. PE A8.2]|uniref:cytochrome c biogenesis CcdA family protein n=1 Tax=Radiobacillus sp. PE A8.2 TaxID=3380349 RepID=UPI00388F829C
MGISHWIVFTAGIVAAFNPCGIAMLPSYISYLIGAEDKKMSNLTAIIRGMGLGVAMTIGFLIIFVVAGFLISLLGRGLVEYLPLLSLIIAISLSLFGLFMLIGKHLPIKTVSFQVKPGKLSVFLYGIAYALASLSCTLPAFLLVISQSINENTIISIFINFVVYSIGMGLVITVITTASLISKQFVQRFLRKYIPVIEKISALIIFLTGLYLVYYWSFGTGGALL